MDARFGLTNNDDICGFTPSTSSSNSTDTQSEASSTGEVTNNTVINQYITHQYQFNFQELEQTIGYMDENTDIIKWFNDLNDYSLLFNWNDLQKFIIAKKLLIGLPKLFIQSENLNIKTWSELKSALINEFSINSYQLHKMLSERKLNKNESLYEYFLKMEEIAQRGAIDFQTFINYILNGIPNDLQMKYLLYDVKNIYELKEKLKIMSKFQDKLSMNSRNSKKEISTGKQEENELQQNNQDGSFVSLNNTCLNCGENNHEINNCPMKNNRNSASKSQELPRLSQDSIQQIAAMILPYFTNTMDEIKDSLKENSTKLTNTKIEVERLSELTSRHTIALSSLTKRAQIIEDKEKTLAGFLAGVQLDKSKESTDNNVLKKNEKVSKNDEKKTNLVKVTSDESDSVSDDSSISENVEKKSNVKKLNLVKSEEDTESDGSKKIRAVAKKINPPVQKFTSDAINVMEGIQQLLANFGK